MKSPMIDEYKCGCVIAGDKLGIITWSKCAIHSKAPAMYEALKKIKKSTDVVLDRASVSNGELFLANDIFSIATSALEGL